MGIINDDYYQCFKKDSTDSFYTQDSRYIDCDALIGYSYNSAVPISFLVIAIIGLVLNFLLIRDFIIKSNTSSRRQSSMKKLFSVLPVLDRITYIYLIVSSVAFKKVKNICDHKNLCTRCF